MKRRNIPDELLALMAEKFRMLGDHSRLSILHVLMIDGELNVGQIVAATGYGVANVSKHLKLLAEAKLIKRSKEGSYVRYRLDDPVVERICELVCDSLRREIETQLKRHQRVIARTRKQVSRASDDYLAGLKARLT